MGHDGCLKKQMDLRKTGQGGKVVGPSVCVRHRCLSDTVTGTNVVATVASVNCLGQFSI
jgi:hypothetical protein